MTRWAPHLIGGHVEHRIEIAGVVGDIKFAALR